MSSADTDTATDEIRHAPEHYDEPVERFIFEVSDANGIEFDDAARERLRAVFRQTVESRGAELVEYEAHEASVTVGFINTTDAPLARLRRVVQRESQQRYEKRLKADRRRSSRPPAGDKTLKWGGGTYLGPLGEDYRENPPEIPADGALDHLPSEEIRRLAMAHGIRDNQQTAWVKEELRTRRPDGPGSLGERVRVTLSGKRHEQSD